MWLKRKPKNRRHERGHILDVKVQSRQLRSMRVRRTATLFARVFAAVTILFLLWRGGDWVLNEAVFKNPAFAIQTIDIETDGILPKAQLRSCAGVNLGDNLLALDLGRIQRDLEYLPWIKSAAVERVHPHTLRIRVIEREPIAQTVLFEPAAAEGRPRFVTFYFDAEGYVMLPLSSYRFNSSALGFDQLPMMTGVSGVDLRPGHPVESRQIQSAIRLVTEFGRSAMVGQVDLTSIDVSNPQFVQVSTGQGAVVTFGVDDLELQMRRWRLVTDYASRNARAVAFLDLSVTNNVPARWVEAMSVPPVKPKSVKSSPYKKKHV